MDEEIPDMMLRLNVAKNDGIGPWLRRFFKDKYEKLLRAITFQKTSRELNPGELPPCVEEFVQPYMEKPGVTCLRCEECIDAGGLRHFIIVLEEADVGPVMHYIVAEHDDRITEIHVKTMGLEEEAIVETRVRTRRGVTLESVVPPAIDGEPVNMEHILLGEFDRGSFENNTQRVALSPGRYGIRVTDSRYRETSLEPGKMIRGKATVTPVVHVEPLDGGVNFMSDCLSFTIVLPAKKVHIQFLPPEKDMAALTTGIVDLERKQGTEKHEKI